MTIAVPYSMSTAAAGAVIAAISVAILPTLTSSSPSARTTISESDDDDGGSGEFECPRRNGSDGTSGNFTTIIVQQVGCILTYGGCIRDIIINYTLLVLNLVFCVGIVVSVTGRNRGRNRSSNQQATTQAPSLNDTAATTITTSYRRRCLFALVFVIGFQIGLCLCVGCSGISIIWCAMCGWIMKNDSEKRHAPHQEQQLTEVQQHQAADENSEPGLENSTTDSANPADEHSVTNSTDNVDLSTRTDHDGRFETTWIGRQRNLIICCDVLIIVYYAVSSPFITTIAHFCALVLGAVLSMMTSGINDTNNNSNHNQVSGSIEIDASQVLDPSESVSQPLLTPSVPPT
mmetsp:Transcript_59472/g.145596  ORF Transcript_59472/g.145596 Transcript_59472/m.145596 type:complete len:346 (-) Transcript_59472:6892-7929(-)